MRYQSAHRDDAPDRFRIDRNPSPHGPTRGDSALVRSIATLPAVFTPA
jgi:hypothetical protein